NTFVGLIFIISSLTNLLVLCILASFFFSPLFRVVLSFSGCLSRFLSFICFLLRAPHRRPSLYESPQGFAHVFLPLQVSGLCSASASLFFITTTTAFILLFSCLLS